MSNFFLIGHSERQTKENGREEIIREMLQENFPEIMDMNLQIESHQHYEGGGRSYQDISESKNQSERKDQGLAQYQTFQKLTLEASKQWSNAFKVLRESYHKYVFLCPNNYEAMLTTIPPTYTNYEDRVKISSNMQGLKKFISYTLFLRK